MSQSSANAGFPTEFVQHAVAGALQSVNEATERTLGRPMSEVQTALVRSILISGLAELQRMRPMAISPLDAVMTGHICAVVRGQSAPIEPLRSESNRAVVQLFREVAESSRAFTDATDPRRPFPPK